MKKLLLFIVTLVLSMGLYADKKIYEVNPIKFNKDFKFRYWQRHLEGRGIQKIKQSILLPNEKLVVKSKTKESLAVMRDLYITIFENEDTTLYIDFEYSFKTLERYHPKEHYQSFWILIWDEFDLIEMCTIGTSVSYDYPFKKRKQNRIVPKKYGYYIEDIYRITIIPTEAKWIKMPRGRK